MTKGQVGWSEGDPEDPGQALRHTWMRWMRIHHCPPPGTDHLPFAHPSLGSCPPHTSEHSWPCGISPDSPLLATRSSVMRLSMGTWPRRPWRSPFGITTLENPMISLVRGNGFSPGQWPRIKPHPFLPGLWSNLGSQATCPPTRGFRHYPAQLRVTGRDRPGGSHRSLWWSRRERW